MSALLFATSLPAIAAPDAECGKPVDFTPAKAQSAVAPLSRVSDYHAVFQVCHNATFRTRIAIRRMKVDGAIYWLGADPESLETSLERDACWTCVDTTDDAQENTRLARTIRDTSGRTAPGAHTAGYLRNAGLVHGEGEGSFITGDLCPALQPLQRAFFDTLEKQAAPAPIALAISGLWLLRHSSDFQWLREKHRSGALKITWVNHSFHHPYAPARPLQQNLLLTPGVDLAREIFDTERLLIANGATPSIFFRFPGLISRADQMQVVRQAHLAALGADGWLVFAPPLRPGAVVLVHPNGNEPAGLRVFAKRLADNSLPRPFRALSEAPTGFAAAQSAVGGCPANSSCPRNPDE